MNAMNFAHDAQHRLAAGFKAVARLLLGAPAVHATHYRLAYAPVPGNRGSSPAPLALQKRTPLACPASLKPLRVLRVMEPGQQRTCVGRMVISGRMADVCAELDRLAAREAAMS